MVPSGHTHVLGVPHDVDVLGASGVGNTTGDQLVREMALERARREDVARHCHIRGVLVKLAKLGVENLQPRDGAVQRDVIRFAAVAK